MSDDQKEFHQRMLYYYPVTLQIARMIGDLRYAGRDSANHPMIPDIVDAVKWLDDTYCPTFPGGERLSEAALALASLLDAQDAWTHLHADLTVPANVVTLHRILAPLGMVLEEQKGAHLQLILPPKVQEVQRDHALMD